MFRLKFSFFAVALAYFSALTLCVGCQSDASKRLTDEVSEAASECPIFVAEDIVIDKIEYTDNVVTYYTSVSDDLLQIKTLREETDTVNRLIYNAIKDSASPEIQEQLNLCAEAGAKIIFAFSSPNGDTFDVEIDPKDYEPEK